MKVVRKSGLIIKKSDYPAWEQVKQALTRRSRDYQTSLITTNEFFLESDSHLLIPRFFPLDAYNMPYTEIEDKRSPGKVINIRANIIPRTDLQKRAMDYMIKKDSGIIQLPPGAGKTVITIYVIANRKRKSIILVHRTSLVNQWITRFTQFSNLKKSDISQLRSNNYIEDLKKPIIIATNQTFLSILSRDRGNFLRELSKANIGIFIGDEVHTTVGAPTFAECSIHIPAKVVFGLSATPYRWDGNGDIIEYHLGDIYTDNDDAGTMDAKVTVVLLDYDIIRKSQFYVYWGGRFQRTRYLNLLKKSKPFLGTIKGLMKKLADRDLLIVAERIKLIELLYKWVKSPSKSMFTGNATNDKLNYQIVFGTPGKIRDGVDIPKKDCLIMTSPISNVDQMTGRICRPLPNKKTPLVIDMVDFGCGDICLTLFNRLEFYRSKDWPVKGLFINQDGTMQEMDISTISKIIIDKWSRKDEDII